MKKLSVLAVAVAAAFAASAASAATIYDKDGTSLAFGGFVEAMVGSSNSAINSHNDSTVRDRARMNITGRSQLTSNIAGYGTYEWEFAHSGTSEEAGDLSQRLAFVGVDFNQFGKVQVGRYVDPFEFASNVVDVLDEVGPIGGFDERNSGHLSYMWSGYGFDAGISYQFAEDAYKSDMFSNKKASGFDVDSGFSVYAGYTSPAVLFGPISVRAGYLYLDGQDKNDLTTAGTKMNGVTGTVLVDDVKSIAGALSWGTNNKGFYIATSYNYSKANVSAFSDQDDDGTFKMKVWDTVIKYGFNNGIVLAATYDYAKYEVEDMTAIEDQSGEMKHVQLIVDYNVSPNFKVWVEGLIDAGSDDGYSKYSTDSGEKANGVMFGAKYTF